MPPEAGLLYVTTISSTIRSFLLPYAAHFREIGWRVEAASNGVSNDAGVAGAFDHLHELAFSRSIIDVAGAYRGARAIRTVVRDSRPDIVHVHTPIASLATRLAIRSLPARQRPMVVYTAHGFHFHRHGRALTNAAFLLAERVAGRWADRLVVINDEDEAAAVRHRIVPAEHVVRMPGIGLDTTSQWLPSRSPGRSEAVRAGLNVPYDAPMFVTVGELNANKRQADAVLALAALRDRRAHLVLVGDGPRRSALQGLATRIGVGDRVRFAGFTADVRPIVEATTALLATSKREGLNRSIMEALSLEVPVVATSARGNAELVNDAGFIVRIGDVAGMASAMDWLIEHPVERRSMGARGRERMVQRYDVSRVIAQHEAMYRDMLAERSVAAGRPGGAG